MFFKMPSSIHKRSSVLNILLIRIFIIVILFNIVLAIINIQQTIPLQKDNEKKRRENIQLEVNNIFRSWETALVSVEKIFYNLESEITQKLVDLYPNKDLKRINLPEQMKLFGLDPECFESSILQDGIIVNPPTLKNFGLSWYSFGQEHTQHILNIQKNGVFFFERFEFEQESKRLKSYSYRPTKDKKYLVQLGVYSEITDELMQIYRDQLKNITKNNENIPSLNFWMGYEDYSSGFIDDTLFYEFQQVMACKVYRQKTSLDTIIKRENRIYSTEFYYKKFEKYNSSINEVVVSIVTDITDSHKAVYTIIKKQIINTSILLVSLFIILLIATRGFKNILNDLLQITTSIAGGETSARVKVLGNNEFTTLAEQFNSMVDKLELSYNELDIQNGLIESKNFILEQQKEEIAAQRDALESSYRELDNQNSIIESNNILLEEQKEDITTQRDEIEAHQNIVIQQNEMLAKKNADTLDSILYAKRIQEALLPNEHYIDEVIPDNFIIYKPRDVVSGDFYWIRQVNQYIIIVAADCTGHGVPGAFMSMLGISMLNEIVVRRGITQANLILNELRKQLKRSLRQTGKDQEAKDGMDLALCIVDTTNNHLQYSGAYNPLLLATQGEIQVYSADRMPIGIQLNEKPTFSNHEIDLKPGDTFYIFSDGFVDQLGGLEGKKFMMKQLKQLLTQINEKSLPEQRYILENTLSNWMKGHEQTDDILIMGIRI